MLHELKEIIQQAIINQKKGLKNVLVTVVDLNGSSYRKPGVRMLISNDDSYTGAVSGGCVEKEIMKRAQAVFADKKAKIITYDGRYRLGCEGILYILIEPFIISDAFLAVFLLALENRETIKIDSYYKKQDEAIGNYGSALTFKKTEQFTVSDSFSLKKATTETIFTQHLQPLFKLLIIGGEHDAVKLSKIAANLGWQIEVITAAKDAKTLSNFPGAHAVIGETPETIQFSDIEENTAIVLMNHSYVQDLKYLVQLSKYQPKYIGILGAPNRREKLFDELFEFSPETTEEFLDCIYTPAGLNIGAKTPEEIAISIIAEILSVIREKKSFPLRDLQGKIHN
ncbi:XdhC and CoxI family protein [Polaribacter sp. ALD11]|uniref:XdhC family protein n=1 Tax=Polaribacter sp. ALD11 TaxID=2058137 RepID=UPI000C30FE19|nr:XdhC/CoxI family protein [Polaribacter sp. ALD11]AUC85332.1 XdhC and CoxI family protein [Polaribacter sp. ALD11]